MTKRKQKQPPVVTETALEAIVNEFDPDSQTTFYRIVNLGTFDVTVLDHAISRILKLRDDLYRVTITIKTPSQRMLSLDEYPYDFTTREFDCLGTVRCTKTQKRHLAEMFRL